MASSQQISPELTRSHPTGPTPADPQPTVPDPTVPTIAPTQPHRPKADQHPTSSPPSRTKTATASDEYRLARAYLMRVAEPPAAALLSLVDAVGPVAAAAAVRAADVPDRVLAETSARRHLELAESDLVDAQRAGARLVVPEDEEWPAWPLLCLAAACDRGQRWAGSPLGLWARGPARLADTFERAVSVVGARSATGYGDYVAADIGHHLARAGMTVVSGAAYGIDGAAHRGALAADGLTVAVLGCGVDVHYPAGHATLIDRIAARGLVLSEYPPGTPPARYRFLVRNRLIAALSTGTVVVEAGIRSGARNTATTAAALGKVVLAVPGPITSATSAGCHDLLRTGTAILAGSVPEILESVGPVGEHLAEPAQGPTRRTDGLTGEAFRVHEALGRRTGRTPARIAVESGVPIDRVRALLPELELTDLAQRCDEGWRRAPEP
ncbi:DNA-processing protein DprA [Actinophytocola sediminis]